MTVIRSDQVRGIAQAVVAVVIILGGGGLLYWLLNKPRIADFLIATESEMKKVNWPTRRELIGSTWIVICGTVLFSAALWVIDLLFALLFSNIGILKGM
ncbi:MAG: preprotein translocase subunit SecE [Phycisphaeraceae bacterium]|nr:preprotein translocase subunit SecE [Phycisphaeraceae bacterium]